MVRIRHVDTQVDYLGKASFHSQWEEAKENCMSWAWMYTELLNYLFAFLSLV